MDRVISQKEQNQGNWKKYVQWIFIAIIAFGAFYFFRDYLKKDIDNKLLHIVKVERGDISNTLSASGNVIPAFEREINAPVSTEIKSVILNSGSKVKKGDLILTLDQEYTRLEYEKLDDALELRKNNINKLKLQFDKDLLDLDYRDQIKALELSKQEAQLKDQQRLKEIGGSTEEEVERANLALKVGRLEKKILENELKFKKSINKGDKRNLELEYEIQKKSLAELSRKLSETNVKAPHDGVITWINEDLGRTVNKGETLVRIANLDKYKVEARCSDRYAQKIVIGQDVIIKINKKNLKGTVERILPEVVDNTIKFLVTLENEKDANLRPNLKTEVYLITDSKTETLVVKKGAVFKGSKNQEIFIIREGKAIKTSIVTGLSNATHIEIISGLQEGDKIIISDMKSYKHLEEFDIK